ncbi:MAG: PAS domain S-box protein [Anaerolineales bacterium]|nr:PAS domain S-box protein [Anaerolineales bacterium]
MKNQLQEQSQRWEDKDYKRLLESVTDYIYTVKVEAGQVTATYHGPASIQITGYAPQEYEACPELWFEMVHPEDRPAVLGQAAQALAGTAAPPLEHRIVHKEGSIRWIRNTAVLRYDEQGIFMGYDGVIVDITERKQAEEELRRSETRHRALLTAIPDLIFRITGDGQLLDYHRGNHWRDALPADIFYPGQNVQEVLPPDIAHLILGGVEKALQTGVPQEFEYRLSQPQNIQDYETRLVVSGPGEVLGIVRDITQQKRMEEQAIQAERLAALGRLSAALTHEINHPLQLIQSYLELMLDFSLEPDEEKELTQVMRREVERLNETTRRILDFARPHPLQRRRIFVTDLVQEVLALTRKQLQQSKIAVTTDFAEVPLVLAAPDQLTQVFLNMVINAIEAIPTEGKLHLSVYSKEDQVMISFVNNGPPIPSEVLPHIFEPFFTTKAQGSGLGLWVSYNLIQQHGGSLIATNLSDEQGVEFTIALPIAAPLEPQNKDWATTDYLLEVDLTPA